MIIITESGSRYLFRQDIVTRMSEVPISGAPNMVLIHERVSWADVPEIGQRWRFHTARGAINTSRVVGFDFECVDLDASPLD